MRVESGEWLWWRKWQWCMAKDKPDFFVSSSLARWGVLKINSGQCGG
jgi:hypothetical protein